MKELTPSVVCARCHKLVAKIEWQVKIGRFIYCLHCGDEKTKEARKQGSSIFIKPEET